MWKYSTLVSVQILLLNFLWMFFLFPEMRFSFPSVIVRGNLSVEGKFTGGSNPLLYIPIHRAASWNIVLSPNSDVAWNISSRLSNESRGCLSFFLYQPEGCTDQHFTQALHFHWTKQTLRTARVNFSGQREEQHCFFFFFLDAWPFLKIIPSV